MADDTVRKEADPVLPAEKTIMEIALDAQPDTFFLFEPATGRAVRWNKTFERVSGYSAEEIARLPAPASYYSPEDLERAADLTTRILTEGEGTIELELICKDGRRVPTEYRVAAIRDEAGEVTHLISIGRDITERRRMEKQLQETQLHYRDFIDVSSDHVSYWRMPEGLRTDLPLEVQVEMLYRSVCVDTNKTFWTHLGFSSREELVGKSYIDLYGEGEADDMFRLFIESGYSISNLDFQAIRPDGRPTYGLENWHGTIEDGCLTHIWAGALDITDLKLAQEQLRSERDRAQRYLDVAGTIFVALDPRGVVTLVNRKGTEVLGYGAEEIIGRNWFDNFLPEDARAQTKEVYARLMAGEMESVDYDENPVVTRNGEERVIAWHNTALRDDDGRIVGTLSSGEDVTERHRQQALSDARLRLIELSTTASADDLLQAFLDEAERLTASRIGFFHFIEGDQTIALQAWSTNTLANMCTADGKGAHYPVEQAGVWVDCVREGRPVIHNDYASLPHRKGMPEGHAPVVRELVVPVFRGGELLAILGVGNKEHDYDDDDVDMVQSLADLAWDAIERRRAELALQDSEERLRSIAAALPDLVFLLDEDGRYREVLTSNSHLLYKEASALQGRLLSEVFPEEDARRFLEVVRETTRTGETQVIEYTLDVPAGRRSFEGRTSLCPLRAEEKQMVVFLSRDVTDRRRNEEAIRSLVDSSSSQFGEAFFEAMVRSLSTTLGADFTLIGELRSDGTQESVRTLAFHADGEPAENFDYALAGTPCAEVFGRSVCSFPSGVAEQFPEDGMLADMGIQSYVGTPLFGADGSPLGIMAALYRRPLEDARFAESILQVFSSRVGSELERTRVEKTLRRRDNQYHSMLQSAMDGFWVMDAQGQLLDVNEAYCRMTGYGRQELLSKAVRDIVAAESGDETERNIEDIKEGGYDRFETRHCGKDGSLVDVEISATYLPDTERFYVFIRDITEQKKVSTELRAHKEHLEGLVEERTRDLVKRTDELERFNRAMVGRERRVIELKQELNELYEASGQGAPYPRWTEGGRDD